MRNIIIGPVTPVIDLLDEFEENKSTCNRIVTQQIGDVQKRTFQFTQVHLRVEKSSTAYRLKIDRHLDLCRRARAQSKVVHRKLLFQFSDNAQG